MWIYQQRTTRGFYIEKNVKQINKIQFREETQRMSLYNCTDGFECF